MRRFLIPILSIVATPVAAQTDAFAGISGVTIVYYDVSGADAGAIRASIEAKGPVDPNNPARSFGGATNLAIRWRWPIDRAGRCDLAAARVTFAATVTLPRLLGDVPQALRDRLERCSAALARHEATRARYAYQRRDEIVRAIRRATCKTADAAATRVLDDIVAHERALDEVTQHGASDENIYP